MNVNVLVNSIYFAITEMRRKFNTSPTTVILGRQVIEQLKTYTQRYIVDWNYDDDILTIFGIPLTIDEVNIDRITVCIGQDVTDYYKEVM